MDHLINQAFDNLRMHNEILYLRAKVKRLEEEVNYDKRVQLHVDKLAAEFTQVEVERLTAEVDRLRKAALNPDDVIGLIEEGHQFNPGTYTEKYLIKVSRGAYLRFLDVMTNHWNAAKEGKPSV